MALIPRRYTCLMLLIVALCSWSAVLAEVSTDPFQEVTGTIIMGIITEDPDPIGQIVWQPFRSIPVERILNPDGAVRGDNTPAVTWRNNGWPVAVWAHNVGTDRDIAFAEWTGDSWSAVEFLTASTEDELDPRIFIEPDGTICVVWWTLGTQEIWLAIRDAGSTVWSDPELVSAGRRPSVLVELGGDVLVAFERDSASPGMIQDVVVARPDGPVTWSLSVVASTTRSERLDTVLHANSTDVWLDWKHGVGQFGCAEWVDPAWSVMSPEPWPDPSWVGVEATRKAIQRQVVGN